MTDEMWEDFDNYGLKLQRGEIKQGKSSQNRQDDYAKIPQSRRDHYESDEQWAFRLKCIHYRVCKYVCWKVCPYREEILP